MNLFTSKGMLLYSTILLISSVILFAQNAEPLYISTDLNNPIQRIGTIIFAPPAADNGGWQATGQVPMSAENEKVTIEGSLLTNGTQNNVIQTPTPKNVSILGGKG
ncbi:MAG: hypothetical protein LBG59_09295, partial [Candidatus Peribacteria bacterium]|nr:hypothetical protein [Candidatus Peribacteria bacterium]